MCEAPRSTSHPTGFRKRSPNNPNQSPNQPPPPSQPQLLHPNAGVQVAWAGAALLVTSNQENVLRFWNLEKDENYLLPLAEREEKDEARKGLVDRIVAISYNRCGPFRRGVNPRLIEAPVRL